MIQGNLIITGLQFNTFTLNITNMISAKYSNLTLNNINFTNCYLYGSFLTIINCNLTANAFIITNSFFYDSSFFFNDFDGVLFPSNLIFQSFSLMNLIQNISNSGALFFYSNPNNYSFTTISFIQAQFTQISSSFFSFFIDFILFLKRII